MRKIRKKRALLLVLSFFIMYFIMGLILPFCQLKSVGKEYQLKVQEREYYGEEGAGLEQACIIETAQEALDIRIQMINCANKKIVLATFDMRDCESMRDMAASLLQAADRGVEIEILVDGVSGMLRMKKPLFQLLGSHKNIEIRLYNEPNPLLPWTINGRMHDKYIMVDGIYLLMGGRNTFDYFLGAYTDKNLSLDREVFFVSDIQTEGSAIMQMNQYFEDIWKQKECKPLYNKEKYGNGKKQQELKQELEKRYQEMQRSMPDNFKGISFVEQAVPINKATLLYNPTHITGKEPWVFYELSNLMKQAEERVYIHTPYVVCNNYMYKELSQVTAKERVIQLNAIANGDNICASSDYIHNKEKILECGLTVYEYNGGDSSHGKSVVIDDRLSIIGSFNFDMRSAYIDTELMFVIDSQELNQDLYGKLKMLEEDSIKIVEETLAAEEDRIEPLPKGKEWFLKIFGWFMQPFRYFL